MEYGQWRVTGVISGRMADRSWTDSTATVPRGFSKTYLEFPAIYPDETAIIEYVLPEAYCEAIYRSDIVLGWMKEEEKSPIDCGGGVVSITVRSMEGIPIDVLMKMRYYDVRGKRRRITREIAEQITSAINKSLEMEP